MNVDVVAHERVVVPAGEFDAFKLISKARMGGTSPIDSRYDAVATTAYCHAPAARTIVNSIPATRTSGQRRRILSPSSSSAEGRLAKRFV